MNVAAILMWRCEMNIVLFRASDGVEAREQTEENLQSAR